MTSLVLPLSSLPSLLLIGLVLVGMMLLMQRPMKKQQEAARQLQASLGPGSRVVLQGGLFGTVTHLGDKQAIVELAPGLEVTVLRQSIAKAVTPDEEEFEFADDAPIAADTNEQAVMAGTAVVAADPAADAVPDHLAPTAASESTPEGTESVLSQSSLADDGFRPSWRPSPLTDL